MIVCCTGRGSRSHTSLCRIRRIQQHRGPGCRHAQQILPFECHELVAGHEAGLGDQVRRMDRFRTEAQMRNRLRAGFVRVVNEISLRIETGILGDDLHAVLVRADRAVGAKSVEDRAGDVGLLDHEAFVDRQAGMADVVVDAHGEAGPWPRCLQFVERGLGHCRSEIFRRQAVAAADHSRHRRPLAGRDGAREGGHDILEQRFAGGARLLRPVQNGDAAHGVRQGRQQMGDRKRPIQAHLQHADLFARCPQGCGGGTRGFGARSHQDQHPFGVRVALIVEQMILPAGHARRGAAWRLQRCRARCA